MKILPLEIEGVFLIELEPINDDRGFFARSFCGVEFKTAGLWNEFPQHNISSNKRRGTVRGMHYQQKPHEEVKVVRCIAGAIDDVVVDLRDGSESFGQHVKAELSADNHKALYIPGGFAHGFQTLSDDTVVSYLMGTEFHSDASGGFRWDDPAFEIEWELPVSMISKRDMAYPDFQKS